MLHHYEELPLDLFKGIIDRCVNVVSATLAKLRLLKSASYSSWAIVDDLLTTLSDKLILFVCLVLNDPSTLKIWILYS